MTRCLYFGVLGEHRQGLPFCPTLTRRIKLDRIQHYRNTARPEQAEAATEAEARRVTFAKFREMYLKQIKNGGRSTYTGKNFAPGTIVAIRSL